ncbi:YlxQ family RNA-binding protein [Shouchella shacheensis]|uniref:YlxQ family RNA-binding protein n=1 Tax=Shouchella shacheensis TaxID=1649580 RepID=UPI00073FED2B|nr:YlxQ family RNA-binding protein [Shouchella shacheensis]
MSREDPAWLSLLGLCQRANQLTTGEELVLKEVRERALALVLLSADASAGTKKKVLDKCGYYQIPVYVTSDRRTLGRAIGKAERVVIGVRSEGFAKKLATLLSQ